MIKFTLTLRNILILLLIGVFFTTKSSMGFSYLAPAGISEISISNGPWITGLYDFDKCKIFFNAFISNRLSVNKWRLAASLVALSDQQQEQFLQWADSVGYRDHGIYARVLLHQGKAIKPRTAYELWEILYDIGYDAAQLGQQENKRPRQLKTEMLYYAQKYKLLAHGTMGFLDLIASDWRVSQWRDSTDKYWALLNIMIKGKITHGDVGQLTEEESHAFKSARYGPCYVILNQFAKDQYAHYDRKSTSRERSSFYSQGSIGSKKHAIYLVPDEKTAAFLIEGIRKAIDLNLIKRSDAVEALSKIMTYQDFVNNHEQIQNIVKGTIKPIEVNLQVQSPTQSAVDSLITSF